MGENIMKFDITRNNRTCFISDNVEKFNLNKIVEEDIELDIKNASSKIDPAQKNIEAALFDERFLLLGKEEFAKNGNSTTFFIFIKDWYKEYLKDDFKRIMYLGEYYLDDFNIFFDYHDIRFVYENPSNIINEEYFNEKDWYFYTEDLTSSLDHEKILFVTKSLEDYEFIYNNKEVLEEKLFSSSLCKEIIIINFFTPFEQFATEKEDKKFVIRNIDKNYCIKLR